MWIETSVEREVAPPNALLAERCPDCGDGDVIAIDIAVGSEVVGYSTCLVCEAKWWRSEGEDIARAAVSRLDGLRAKPGEFVSGASM